MLKPFEKVGAANAQRTWRLGVVLITFAVLALGVAAPGFIHMELEGWGLAFLAGIVGLAAAGVGLLFAARSARCVGLLIFLCLAVMSMWSCGKFLMAVIPAATWSVDIGLWIANGVATTLLLVWLSIRAIQILLDSARPTGMLTARLSGAVLVVVGLAHLNAVVSTGTATGGFSISISPTGIQLAGFPGWALWHVALVPIAACLLVGWRRALPVAALLLIVLVASLSPLMLFAAWDLERIFDGEVVSSLALMAGLTPLLLAYLCWWLAVELRVSWKAINKRDLLIALALLGGLIALAAIALPKS